MEISSNENEKMIGCLASSDSGPIKRHVRRKMTEQEKIDYRRRRVLRACMTCANSKRKCNHNQAQWENGTATRLDKTGFPADGHADRSIGFTKHIWSPWECSFYTSNDTGLETTNDVCLPAEHEVVFEIRQYPEEMDGDVIMDSYFPDETTLSLHKPQSPETLSAILFVENINCEGVADAWFGDIPSRIGNDYCLDLAIAALQMTCWYKRRLPGATLPKVYHALAGALEALATSLRTDGAALCDHTLASVAALSPVEAIRAGHTFLVPTHLDGITAILVSRAAVAPLSKFARRILEYHFCDSYVMASIRGVVSPLENLDRVYCTPCDLSGPIPETKLRAIGNELCVRLPRLIAYARVACEQFTSAATVSAALTLAEKLLQLKDEAAENDFLHTVGVARTTLPTDLRITKYSLQFKTISSFEAGAYYWHTRTALLRLCCRLRCYFPTMSEIYLLPSVPELKVELQRLASNIVMTAEFARTLKARKRRRLFGHSLLACWSIFRDHADAFPGEKNLEEVRTWLLENVTIALLGRTSTLNLQDMDDAAELFEGGPLVGTYMNLYDAS